MNKLIRVSDDDKQRCHFYLTPDDDCYYLGLYHADLDPSSGLNQLIWNFKKSPTLATSNPSEFWYKAPAIRDLAAMLDGNFITDAINNAITFVPVPPSKAKSDPEYDDRLVQLLTQLTTEHQTPDVQDILATRQSRATTHSQSAPYSNTAVTELQSTIDISYPDGYIPRQYTMLVDDVLRRGTHYAACKNLLQQHFPETQIVGIFLAKTHFPL